jgi:hypothetical protein
LVVIGLGAVLLTVPAISARSALGPKARVLAACASAVSGIWMLGVGTLLTASPLLLSWHDQGELSRVDIGHLSPGGPVAWSASAVLAGLGASWVLSFLRRSGRARRRAALPRWAATEVLHEDLAGAEVRVAPTLEPVAFAVPGRDRHVVVSESVTRLAAPERRAVLAHEGAHLRLGHHRHLLMLGTYQRVWGWVPGVRSVVADHRRSIEQWADLEAARHDQVDQQAVVRARARLSDLRGASGSDPERHSLSSESSMRALVGVTVLVAALVTAGAYGVAHFVGDASAVMASLH